MKELNYALYRKIYLIRRAEEAIRRHYASDKMKTPMHMSAGSEAIAAGVCQALRIKDQIMGTYRSHGIYLAKSGETDRFFAEMYGKSTGMAKGKAGSMHLTAPEVGLISTSAIVGTTIPVALGAAFANQQKGSDSIVAVFFGDGAIDEGVFWESINIACVMKLSVLFVCEDNDFAVHTSASQRHGYRNIVDVVARFDCNVFNEESTDAETIYNLTQRAIGAIRDNQQPSFLHLKYCRYLEHVGISEDFDAGYRNRVEYERWRAKDPLDLQRKKLLQWYSEDNVRHLETEIDRQVEDSINRADAAPYSASSALYEDVYA